MNDWPILPPAEAGADSVVADEVPGQGAGAHEAAMPSGIPNGDLSADRADPGALAPTSDPDPNAPDAPFPGRPRSDAEIDALPG
jgi:hypothetical protein